jgi:hypothetical protein
VPASSCAAPRAESCPSTPARPRAAVVCRACVRVARRARVFRAQEHRRKPVCCHVR